MKQKVCRECGHVFSLYGRDVEVRTGYKDDSEECLVWEETHTEYLCSGCSEKYPYDAEWDGVYYKEVPINKDGTTYERE